MVELYNDTNNRIFNLNLKVDDFKTENLQVRMILKFEQHNRNYIFDGTLNAESNKFQIIIPILTEIENDKGMLQVEVIADDMLFRPWESEFIVKAKKKLSDFDINSHTDEQPKSKISFSMDSLDDETNDDFNISTTPYQGDVEMTEPSEPSDDIDDSNDSDEIEDDEEDVNSDELDAKYDKMYNQLQENLKMSEFLDKDITKRKILIDKVKKFNI